MIDVGHLAVFGRCVECETDCVAPCWTCPAPSPATASTATWPRTTARSTASSARSRAATASSTSPTATSIRVTGPDRLTWLHSLTTQHLEALAPKALDRRADPQPAGPRRARVLRRRRRRGVHRAHRARARPPRSSEFLDRMRFMMRVEVTDVTDELAVTWRPSRRGPYAGYELVPRDRLDGVRRGGRPGLRPVGLRGAADRARRAAARPRHRPPHDPQRGRLDRPGRPPRQGLLPRPGDRRPGAHPRPAAAAADAAAPRRLREPAARGRRRAAPRRARWSASSAPRARHHELGPIALAMVKRNVPLDAPLTVDGHARRPGGPGRPRGRPARAPAALIAQFDEAALAAPSYLGRERSGCGRLTPLEAGSVVAPRSRVGHPEPGGQLSHPGVPLRPGRRGPPDNWPG